MKQLKIVKVQRPLFSSDGSNDIMVYGADPITGEQNTAPEIVDWSDEQIEVAFADNEAGDENDRFNKAYWLVYGDEEGTAFIAPVFLDKWE